MSAHHHRIAVRYGEVDLQGVVFNAHYLAYLDDAIDRWMRSLDGQFEADGWDYMVKRADLVWHGAAGLGDVLDIVSAVSRWGTTSFDVTHQVRTGDHDVLTATITYVGVDAGTTNPAPPPDRIRRHLGDATAP
jgi:acyl-CoA thioester hydrolase